MKFEDKIRVINFEPIEIYVSLMIVICLIFINLNFFENFFQDMMLQIQMSQFIILDIQLSHLTIMFCVQVVVQWKNIFQLSQNFSWT